MATYAIPKNKRILFCGLNVDCLLVGLVSYKFGSDFSEKLVKFLLEALRLNDNHFVRHTCLHLEHYGSPPISLFMLRASWLQILMFHLDWPSSWP